MCLYAVCAVYIWGLLELATSQQFFRDSKIAKGLAASVVGAQPGFMLPILQSPICVRRQHRNMVVGVIVRATVTSDSPHGVPAIVVFISPALHNFQAQGT